MERQIERDLLEEALLANEEQAGVISREIKDEATVLFREVKASPELQGDTGWHAREAD